MSESEHVITLPNGLTLAVQPRPHLRGVAVSALVRVGSGDESPAQAGLAHLLEHMLFRGSQQYRTAKSLMAPFEDAGGVLEAETWRDHTHFSALLHHDHVAPALMALGDMLQRPRLTHLAAERRLVEAEIEGELDEQGEEATLHSLSRAAIWGEHPMARRITGSIEGVRRHDKAALAKFHRSHYVGHRVVVSLAGAITLAEAQRLVSAAFGRMSAGTPAAPLPIPAFAPPAPLAWVAAAGPQVSLQMSFEAFALHDKWQPIQELIGALLSDGMLSRLQHALSDHTGLVYAYDGGFDVYRGFGTYDLEIQVAPSRAAEALQRAMDVFRALAHEGPTPEELARAKRRAQLSATLDYDRAAEAAYEAGLTALFDGPSRATLARTQQISCADVRQVAQALFFGRGRHLLVMGPPTSRLRTQLTRAWAAPSDADAAPSPNVRRSLRAHAAAAKRYRPAATP